MRTLLSFLIIAFATVMFANGGDPVPSSKSIDVNTSKVMWKGYKVTGQHEGAIKVKSGSFTFEGDVLIGGKVTMDMTSITCTDLSGGMADKLVGHLKSDDFFGVANNPTATFEITKVVSRGTPGDYKLIGDVTIKGKTQEVRFLASVKDGRGTATLKLDRSDYDVKYNSGSFFDNLGDKTIYDEFDIVLDLRY